MELKLPRGERDATNVFASKGGSCMTLAIHTIHGRLPRQPEI